MNNNKSTPGLDLFIVEKNKDKVKKRPVQIGKEIKNIIDNLLLKGRVKDILLFDNTIIISEVKVSSDLSLAKVYVYPLASAVNSSDVVEALNKQASFFKKHIGKSLHIKVVPTIVFFKEDHFDKIEATEAMFKGLPKYNDDES